VPRGPQAPRRGAGLYRYAAPPRGRDKPPQARSREKRASTPVGARGRKGEAPAGVEGAEPLEDGTGRGGGGEENPARHTFGCALAASDPHSAVALPVAYGSVPAGPPAFAVCPASSGCSRFVESSAQDSGPAWT
jgi:hypothetical protein